MFSPQPPQASTMNPAPQRPKERKGVILIFDVTIEVLNLAKEVSSITPAKAVFGSVSIVLTMIKESMANRTDCVELGLACAEVCGVLERGTKGKQMEQLNESVFEAIERLKITVDDIRENIAELGKRNVVSRVFHSKYDKDMIAGWKLDLSSILQIFNTELALNTNVAVSEIHRVIVEHQAEGDGRSVLTQTRTFGETPPPAPRACFGRDELVDRIVGLIENFTPVALIGAGGIGKTSTALAVLHHDRVKAQFGDERRFIRCDRFPASCAHFLARLSKVTGAGVENPEDLASLRQFLSSKKIFIVLDNAESILDPQGPDGQGIYTIVEELSQFSNVSLCITSRITTIPPDCKRLDVPPLSIDAARSAFYRIYDRSERSDVIDTILKQLDFHPLSVTLLATVAHQNSWDDSRLVREWENRRTSVLQTEHNKSLAAAMELSLSSPMFKELGSDARDLLEVIAFYPQGVSEDNAAWLLPTIVNLPSIFDKLCILSLTYRSDGFITMLAPLRDYLHPTDPTSSTLLCTTKERYFTRMSINIDPNDPQWSEDSRWITSEDVNVEHLLDVFTSVDANSDDIWRTCAKFLHHLLWHKPRRTILGKKMETLSDDHQFKFDTLLALEALSQSLGNNPESKRLLMHAIELERARGDDQHVALLLYRLSGANMSLRLHKEGIHQVKEALGIFERIGEEGDQAMCLVLLAQLLQLDKQLAAAEEAGSRAIKLLPREGKQLLVCQSHQTLGQIYRSKGEREKAISHFEEALRIASRFNFRHFLFMAHCDLAILLLDEDAFDDAHTHIDQAKLHALNDTLFLGHAYRLQARVFFRQHRFDDARTQAQCALKIFDELGDTEDQKGCQDILQEIESAKEGEFTLESGSSTLNTPSDAQTNTSRELEVDKSSGTVPDH